MRIRNSFWAMLGQDVFESHDDTFKNVSEAMLNALMEHCGQKNRMLHMDISNAKDLSELWYLRPRLLQALAGCKGDEAAEKELHKITDMFKGHFAKAITSRFGS